MSTFRSKIGEISSRLSRIVLMSSIAATAGVVALPARAITLTELNELGEQAEQAAQAAQERAQQRRHDRRMGLITTGISDGHGGRTVYHPGSGCRIHETKEFVNGKWATRTHKVCDKAVYD